MERITLKDNCENFIKEAVSIYCRKPCTLHKKAVSLMLLVQAVELLLKQKLANHSSLLLYENVDKPNKSVSMKSCLKRLSYINQTPDQSNTQKSLRRAMELRGKIMHHEFATNETAIKSDFVRLCGLINELRVEVYNQPLSAIIPKYEMEVLENEESQLAEAVQQCQEEISRLRKGSTQGEPHWCGCCGNNSIRLSAKSTDNHIVKGQCLICAETEDYTCCGHCGKWLAAAEIKHYEAKKGMCSECLENVTENYWYE
ncbi:DUF3644 domain-containing protein [Psychromonas ossibalaenae]|uniref:DUF3644 domain-containing protein n=1 Tax=Psychromonas ossibalaenae TaxID=444922 RepID=UPI000360DB23|nr:DUF3644 domain-containing protein [Psychromonas ossibalaenae]